MLVALPSAIAFGVAILAPLGSGYGAQGALAGILGAMALGIFASTFGGTNRLITAPCAPAAAVLAGVAIELTQGGTSAPAVVLMLAVIGLLCGALQALFGVIGLGRLIKYMPYPVVSGYLSGVGLTIIVSQVPKFLGSKSARMGDALLSPSQWSWQAMVVGAATMAVMLLAPRVTKAVPAVILGLAGGVLAYFGLALADPSLLVLEANALVVGPLGGGEAGFLETMFGRWGAVGDLGFAGFAKLLVPAATLAVLLSIDTLKTCVVLDSLTRSRHDSNRELIGQGIGNIASAVLGGVPGAGTMGATLVNMSSGAQTRVSSIAEGVLSLLAFLLLGTLIAWVPIASLAGILMVIGVRMIDRHSFGLLKQRSTVLDFGVICAVIVTALTVSLIAASGVGIALAIMLFLREQIGGNVVRRKAYGNQAYSRHVRLPQEMAILEKHGAGTAVFELQGSLFFGTTDQLFTALETDLKSCTYLILDMHRVQSVDVTATHLLEQIESTLTERNAYLLFSGLPQRLPSGRDMRAYFSQLGLVQPERHARHFGDLDDALEWVEAIILAREHMEHAQQASLELKEMDLFCNRRAETLAALEAVMEKRTVAAGESVFLRGDTGDELFLIRRGTVRIMLPLPDGLEKHLATFSRGDFIGEMAFLDHHPRSANGIAFTDTELFVLSRKRFDALAEEHRMLAINLLEGIARVLAIRLRYANTELEAS